MANDKSIWFGIYNALLHKDGQEWHVFYAPGYTINALVMDHNGFIWAGFKKYGLACFDGSRWKTYRASSTDLPDDYVTSLAVDSQNNIWIGTDAEGLAKLDGDNTWQVFQLSFKHSQ